MRLSHLENADVFPRVLRARGPARPTRLYRACPVLEGAALGRSLSCPPEVRGGRPQWALRLSGSCWSAGELVPLFGSPHSQWGWEHASWAQRAISDLFISGRVSGCRALHRVDAVLHAGANPPVHADPERDMRGWESAKGPRVSNAYCQGWARLRGPGCGRVPWGCLGSRGGWRVVSPVSKQHSVKPPGLQASEAGDGDAPFF